MTVTHAWHKISFPTDIILLTFFEPLWCFFGCICVQTLSVTFCATCLVALLVTSSRGFSHLSMGIGEFIWRCSVVFGEKVPLKIFDCFFINVYSLPLFNMKRKNILIFNKLTLKKNFWINFYALFWDLKKVCLIVIVYFIWKSNAAVYV